MIVLLTMVKDISIKLKNAMPLNGHFEHNKEQ